MIKLRTYLAIRFAVMLYKLYGPPKRSLCGHERQY